MDTKKMTLDGFYRDVSRYIFNYLYDHQIKSFQVVLDDDKQKKIFKSLVSNCFRQKAKFDDFLTFEFAGYDVYLTTRHSEEQVSFNEFKDILYEYANVEDIKYFNLIRKRPFVEGLDFGFSKLK